MQQYKECDPESFLLGQGMIMIASLSESRIYRVLRLTGWNGVLLSCKSFNPFILILTMLNSDTILQEKNTKAILPGA